MSRWFRHYAGMMRDEKLVRVAVKTGQPVERVLWVWGAILESAAELNDGGRFDFDAAEAAYFLRVEETDILALIAALSEIGRICDGIVARWGARQFESDRSASRQAAYRNKSKAGDSLKTQSDGEVTAKDRHGDGGVTATSRPSDAPETETETENIEQIKDNYATSAREDSETGSLVSQEAFAIADELATICGNGIGPETPPGWCGAGMRVQAWLNAGWPKQVMIDGARAVMARRKGKTVENVAYLEKPLADAFERFKQPVPVGTVGGTGPPARMAREPTERERRMQEMRDIRDALSSYSEASERSGQSVAWLLPGHPGE